LFLELEKVLTIERPALRMPYVRNLLATGHLRDMTCRVPSSTMHRGADEWWCRARAKEREIERASQVLTRGGAERERERAKER